MSKMSGVTCLVFVILTGVNANLASAGSGDFNRHATARPLTYDPVKDEFTYRESIISPRPKTRPGGNSNYAGSRIHQYRYSGPRNRGGIYDAFDDHYRNATLDARNYQYRIGYRGMRD